MAIKCFIFDLELDSQEVCLAWPVRRHLQYHPTRLRGHPDVIHIRLVDNFSEALQI